MIGKPPNGSVILPGVGVMPGTVLTPPLPLDDAGGADDEKIIPLISLHLRTRLNVTIIKPIQSTALCGPFTEDLPLVA